MTLFGWDSSHYDGRITRVIADRAKAEGIVFATHKIGEGAGGDDAEDGPALAAFRDAGIEFLGGYHVVRTGDVVGQVDALLRLADRDVPWWREFPGWFWQVDLEKWPYDHVPAALGIAFGRELRERTCRLVVMYASRGQYGNELTGWDGPLWNAAYGTNQPGPFKALYPGDGSSRWAPYSGKTPLFLQYTSAATIAGLTTSDANAFRGTVEELRALITQGGTVLSAEDKQWMLDQLHDMVRWGTPTPSVRPAGGYPAPSLQTAHERIDIANGKLDGLVAAAAGDEARDKAILAAVTALTGGAVDTSAVVAAINAVRDETRTGFADLLAELGEVKADRDRMAAALAAAGVALATADDQ